ncbi:MAG: peroxiredoxin family protein [Pseudomonadota bacterium]
MIHRITVPIYVFLVFLSFSTLSYADTSLKVGDQIPSNLVLSDQFGEEKTIQSTLGDKGAVLVFVRSADWCPFCKAQLIDFRNNLTEFKDQGFSVVSISYDSQQKLMKFEKKHQPEFTLLSDPNSEAIKAFGIFDDSQREGSFSYGIPEPSIFIVDRLGNIKAILAEESYKERPQIKSVMEEVMKITQNNL